MGEEFKSYFQRNLKKAIAKFGSVALLDEVAEANLASALSTKINGKADASTTLAGYGITNAYTKTETDDRIAAQVSAVYKPAGNKTMSELTSALLVVGNLGKVYNVTDGGTTTSDFVSGAGNSVSAGTDVAVVNTGTDQAPVYKFNVLSGFIDLSGKADVASTLAGYGITDAYTKTEVDTAVAGTLQKTDLSAETTGDGNVVTAVSYSSSTGKTTATKGATAVLTTDLVDLTDAEVNALFT